MIMAPASATTRAVGANLECRLQMALLIGVWLFVCGLHWQNDGLWMTDATRHAANGLFWKDFLAECPADPKSFALSYYARYPVINPTAYPPLFYLLEAAAFLLFGSAPLVAKSLVLVSSLVTGLVTMAWIRRYVAAQAGWVGVIVMLTPEMVRWSHAVMLNVPGLAFGVVGLYYARRWLDDSRRPGRLPLIIPAIGSCLAAFLTYYTAGVVFPVMIAWLLALRGRAFLRDRWSQFLLLAGVGLLSVVTYLSLRWAPGYVTLLIPQREKITSLENWTYYARLMPLQFGLILPALACLGLARGMALRRWRTEATLMAIWVAVAYLMFSIIRARESRYILTIGPPLIILAAIALASVAGALAAAFGRSGARARLVTRGIALCLVAIQAAQATHVSVSSIRGIKEVAAFLQGVAPGESYFYEGSYDGIFAYYVRAGDPNFRDRVVTGKKLLYAFAQNPSWRLRQYVSTSQEVVDRLREDGGCRWLAIEADPRKAQIAAVGLLREALVGADFEFIRSFPLVGDGVHSVGDGPRRVDIYRLRGPLRAIDEVDLPFPILGPEVVFRIRPIATRKGITHHGD